MSIKSLRRRVDKLSPARPSPWGPITRTERLRAFELRGASMRGELTPAEQEEFAVLSAKMDADAKANNKTEWIHPWQDTLDYVKKVVLRRTD